MKPKSLTGQGRPPRELKAALGQKYRDTSKNKVWLMTEHGWELASFLHIDVRASQKSNWVAAAAKEHTTLEEWATRTLDRVAKFNSVIFRNPGD